MNNSIFLPKKINIGFRERSGTYTGKLAYVVYFDEKNKLRKERSWNNWRDNKIDNIIHENIPVSGFVLNKKVGGDSYGWNPRQTYCRIFDPRGFEFEITIPNLMFILENTNSIKGKGLEGEFIYGWDSGDLVLIPTSSPEYTELKKLNESIHSSKKFKGKDMKIGGTYTTKQNETLVYLGRFDYQDYGKYNWKKENVRQTKKMYFFYNPKYDNFEYINTLSTKIVNCESEECVSNYADLMDKLEENPHYSPVDTSKDVKVYYTEEEFKETFKNKWNKYYNVHCEPLSDMLYIGDFSFDEETQIVYFNKKEKSSWNDNYYYYKTGEKEETTILEVLETYKPYYIKRYLTNGKFYIKIEGK